MIETQQNSDSNVDSETLFKVFHNQAEALGRMKQLVHRQRHAVVQDNPEALLNLLKQRQVVVEALVGMGGEIKRVREQWEHERDSLSPQDRAQAACLIKEMAKSFEEIMEADAQDVRMLVAKKQLISNALHATHATAHAVSAYAGRPPQSRGVSRLDEAS